jgi:hypothetical protein
MSDGYRRDANVGDWTLVVPYRMYGARNVWLRLSGYGGHTFRRPPLMNFLVSFFTSCHDPPLKRAGRFVKLMPQTTSFATRKCLFGVSSMKKFFHWGVPLPPNFQRAFYMQIEKVE